MGQSLRKSEIYTEEIGDYTIVKEDEEGDQTLLLTCLHSTYELHP